MVKRQILVVDDEVSILKLLNFVLSVEYDLVIKTSGVELAGRGSFAFTYFI